MGERSTRVVAAILLAVAVPASAQSISHVRVRGQELGQGFLISRLDTCYAIAPAHVVGSAPVVQLTGWETVRRLGEGDVMTVFKDSDVALIRVDGELARACGGGFDAAPGLDAKLARRPGGTLSSVFDDGTVGRLQVVVTDVGPEFVRIRPASAQEEFAKGMSGSVLSIGNDPAGVLLSVEPNGDGKVYRFDRLGGLLASYFTRPSLGTRTAERRVQSESGAAGNSLRTNLLTMANGGAVLRWSAEPLPGSRASTLIDPLGGSAWLTSARQWPVEIEFQVGAAPKVIRRIQISATGISPQQRTLRDFEVLVATSRDDTWMPVATGTYVAGDATKVIRLAPVTAHRVLLRIYSNWGDPGVVGLSGIAAFSDE